VGFDFEPASYPSDVVDRDAPLRPLDAAEISAIDPALVRKSFLAQFTRSPKPAHIPRQNVPQRPFVSLFRKGDFGSITLLRRPLLSYIRSISRRYSCVVSDRAGCSTIHSKAMRQVHCPHCNATNRRPQCGSCQKEIADPPGIALVWKLYRHRKVVGTASAILALTLLLWRLLGDLLLFLSGQLFGLRSARSNDAMRVLMRLCYEKFPSKP